MGASVLWNFCEAVLLFAVTDGDDDLIAVREPCWFRKMADFPVLFLFRCIAELLLLVWWFSTPTKLNDMALSPGIGSGGGGSGGDAVPVDTEFTDAAAAAAALADSAAVPSVFFFNSLLVSCCFDNNNNVDGMASALAIPFSFISCG